MRELKIVHGRQLAIETIYQALYTPDRAVQRDPLVVLRTHRSYRRRRRRGNQRRAWFIVPLRMIDERPLHLQDRAEPGQWEGDLIVGTLNRSAIATLVERSRYAVVLHLTGGLSRSNALRDQLAAFATQLPSQLRRSLTWDQGSEMSQHHIIAASTGLDVYFCNPGRPWQRPTNENTNGLLCDYFPKSTNLSVRTPADLQRVSNELNN